MGLRNESQSTRTQNDFLMGIQNKIDPHAMGRRFGLKFQLPPEAITSSRAQLLIPPSVNLQFGWVPFSCADILFTLTSMEKYLVDFVNMSIKDMDKAPIFTFPIPFY
ncbi:hypothetical protein Csa_022556 [Cucumis sativus]|nr:hypothetical protein Csa_022556 [Cucumis sativus]